MNGSHKTTNDLTIKEVLAAVKAIKPEQDFIWDGKDMDEQPATAEEMQAAIDKTNTANTTQIALNIDNKTLEAFKSAGSDWQQRINLALKDWLKAHSHA